MSDIGYRRSDDQCLEIGFWILAQSPK
jgi:hypothetical protein